MTEPRTGCPDEETLGAFFEARLEGAERERVVAHLATCPHCIGMLAFANRMRAEEKPAEVVPLRPRRSPWLAVAAVLLVIAGMAVLVQRLTNREPGMATLIAAAPSSYRTVEPRLSGFRWAAMQRLRAGDAAADPEALRLGGAAGEVLTHAQNDPSSEAAHAAGVAELLLQRSDLAVERLRATAVHERDAAIWNDLAAAYYTRAMSTTPHYLPRALDATDRAIAFDPDLLEARFNRALILERMGLQPQAVTAWRDYLTRDASSSWANEARQHLQRLESAPPDAGRRQLERLEEVAAARNREAIDAIVRNSAQDARAWFESDVLGRWGEAVLRGDEERTAALLVAARQTGAALRRFSGEALLRDAVQAIDNASPERRVALARAHDAYRRGRLLYRDRRNTEAAALLLDAERGFDEGRSPMANVARFFVASVRFDENRVAEAAELLESIALAAGHEALRAQIALRLALCRQYSGQWEDAVRALTDAAERFRRLHERDNLAYAEGSLGTALDELGARDEAWRHRVAALELYSGTAPQRLIGTLASAARSELRAGQPGAARALLRIEAEEATALGDALLLADVWRRRALVDAQLDDEQGAHDAVRRARAWMARAKESGLRQRLAAELDIAEAAVVRRRDPKRAIALAAPSTRFVAASARGMLLPDAFLEQGRALRAAGRDADALQAFAAGLHEIETQRRSSPPGAAIFDAVAPMVEETIAVQLARGDAAGAFATTEHAHARALLDGSDTRPATAAEVAAALPPETMLIAYALVPRGLAAICITRDEVRYVEQPVDRRTLEESIRAFRAGIAARENVAARAGALHRLLLGPIDFRGISSLVIVPDRFLHAVPWAALYDPERREYAIERHALTVAPSAALWLRGRSATLAGAHMLVITGGASPDLDPLEYPETNTIARFYSDRSSLSGAEVSPAQFLDRVANAGLVHFAGHAMDGVDPALLLGNQVELRASEIARARLPRSRLVVLAACGTAAGQGDGFDGPRGLARAFLTAGATSVVATLWPVDDSDASQLFVEFHRRFGNGDDAASALRHAQLAMLNGGNPRARHPAAWGAVELFGGNVRM